jgi:hypothetical protein
MGSGIVRGWLGVVWVVLLGFVARPAVAEVTSVTEPPVAEAPVTEDEASGDEGATEEDPGSEAAVDEAPKGDSVAEVREPDEGDQRRVRAGDLDRRIQELREERRQYGLGGPITMMAVGGGVALGAAYVYLLGRAYCLDDCDAPPALIVVGAAGLGVGIWGAVLLGDRVGDRRRNGREIKELERQKETLEVSVLRVVGPNAAGAHVHVTF